MKFKLTLWNTCRRWKQYYPSLINSCMGTTIWSSYNSIDNTVPKLLCQNIHSYGNTPGGNRWIIPLKCTIILTEATDRIFWLRLTCDAQPVSGTNMFFRGVGACFLSTPTRSIEDVNIARWPRFVSLFGKAATGTLGGWFASRIEVCESVLLSLDCLSERTVPSYDITDTDDGPNPGGECGSFWKAWVLQKIKYTSAIEIKVQFQRNTNTK